MVVAKNLKLQLVLTCIFMLIRKVLEEIINAKRKNVGLKVMFPKYFNLFIVHLSLQPKLLTLNFNRKKDKWT